MVTQWEWGQEAGQAREWGAVVLSRGGGVDMGEPGTYSTIPPDFTCKTQVQRQIIENFKMGTAAQ